MWICCCAIKLLYFNPEVGKRKAEFIPKKSVYRTMFSLQKRPTTAEGLYFVLPGGPAGGWRSSLPEATTCRPGNNMTKFLKPGSCVTVCCSTRQKDGKVAPVWSMPSTVPRPPLISEILDCTEAGMWKDLCLPESSKVTPGRICVTDTSLANTRSGWCQFCMWKLTLSLTGLHLACE